MATLDLAKVVAFNQTLSTVKRVGTKEFVEIPLELLEVDDTYQRSKIVSENKINRLASNWNPNQCMPLLVSKHPESGTFAVIDGSHRLSAARIIGLNSLPAMLVSFEERVIHNPVERSLQEAKLFVTQDEQVDKLTQAEKHRANIKLGVEANVALQDICDKYNIFIKGTGVRGKRHGGVGVLKAICIALEKVEADPNLFEKEVQVMLDAGWNNDSLGFGDCAIRMVWMALKLHGTDRETVNALVKIMRENGLTFIKSVGIAKYPKRRSSVAATLYLEDLLCAATGDNYRYLTDDEEVMAIRDVA